MKNTNIDDFDGRNSILICANSMAATVLICADARKEECPYCIPVHIDNEYITFQQYFCGYRIKKGGVGYDE